MIESHSVDEQVGRIRSAILDRHGLVDGHVIDDFGDQSAADRAAREMMINAHWGISSDVPIFGPGIVFARRVMRILLRWYVNPIVEQQNRFNQSAVRALYELQAENDALRAELIEIKNRIDRGSAQD